MNHADHVALLRGGVLDDVAGQPVGLTWADLGSGTGAFTLALAELLGAQGVIYSVDREASSLEMQRRAFQVHFGRSAPRIHYLTADYTLPLSLPPLDGIVMANTLHFHRQPGPVVNAVRRNLKPGGRLIVVEYDADHGNVWVPHPFTFSGWEATARACDFAQTRRLATVPSSFLGRIYSAVSY